MSHEGTGRYAHSATRWAACGTIDTFVHSVNLRAKPELRFWAHLYICTCTCMCTCMCTCARMSVCACACVLIYAQSFACMSRGLEREPFCSQTQDWPFKSFLGCQGDATVKSSDACERVSSWVLLLTRCVDRMTCCLWLVLWHDVILVEGTGILYTGRH